MHRTPLVNLVHNAKLPFVGREEELAQLQQFWEDVEQQQRLIVGLLLGEAGIGKSTLLEHFLHEVGDRCVPLHVRFTTGAATSPVRAIARAIGGYWSAIHSSGVIHSPYDLSEILPEIAATKRLLIALEDIHLLTDEGIERLVELLNTLQSAPFALLCLSRPLSVEAMQQLSRVVNRTIVLQGLQEAEIATLWSQLFTERPSALIVNSIATTTLGNPLVIRSGLLRALSSNAITPTIRSQQVAVAVELHNFQQSLLDSTRSISGAITEQLSTDALQQLQTLATLGEVFPTEAAQIATDNANSLLTEFQQRGILAVAPSAHTSLIPNSSPLPKLLTFSHTVLHRELLSDATPNSAALLAVIGEQVPLYSSLPFTLLAAATDLHRFTPNVLLRALQGIYFYLGAIFASDDWLLSEAPLLAAEQVLKAINDDPNNDDLTEARISLVMLQMERSSRLPDLKSYGDQLFELIRLTSAPLPTSLQHYRLAGKSAKARYLAFHQPEKLLAAVEELYDESQQLIAQHPSGLPYPGGLKVTLVALMALGRRCRHQKVIYWAAEHLELVLDSLDLNNPVEVEEYAETLPFILFVRRSEAEFQKRMSSLRLLESFGPLSSTLLATKGHLLVVGGYAKQGVSILEQIIPRLQKNQQFIHLISSVGSWALGQGMIGLSLQCIIEKTTIFLHGVPDDFPNMAVDTAVAKTAILAYNIEDQNKVEKFLPMVAKQANKKVLRYFAAARRDCDTIQKFAPPSDEEKDYYATVAAILSSTTLTPLLEETVIDHLNSEIVEATDLLHFRALLHGVEYMIERSYPCQLSILPVVETGLQKWLHWLYQHNLFTYANGLISRFGGLLPKLEEAAWKKDITVHIG